MLPYSGMKVIHDQMIDEALERRRYYEGHEPSKQSLRQTFAKVLTRFTAQSGRKQGRPLPDCAYQARCEAR